MLRGYFIGKQLGVLEMIRDRVFALEEPMRYKTLSHRRRAFNGTAWLHAKALGTVTGTSSSAVVRDLTLTILKFTENFCLSEMYSPGVLLIALRASSAAVSMPRWYSAFTVHITVQNVLLLICGVLEFVCVVALLVKQLRATSRLVRLVAAMPKVISA